MVILTIGAIVLNLIKKTTGWKAKWNAEMGAKEIVEKLQGGELQKNSQTITLEWYKELIKWHKNNKKRRNVRRNLGYIVL